MAKNINEAGRQPYTQKKYNYKTRHSIITDAQNEVTRLRGEISALTQQIRHMQDPQAKEQLIAQRQELCKLRNRAVAKVWNLSNERTMTAGAKQRAAIKRKADCSRPKNIISFSPEDVPYIDEGYLHRIVNESINKLLNESRC